MLSRLSINDLDRIQAYCDKATEGPWRIEQVNPGQWWVMSPPPPKYADVYIEYGDSLEDVPDAAFIAHARTDLPALVAELRKARSIIAFFADEQNWQSPSSGFDLQYDPNPSPVQAQGQQIARDFLEE